MTQALRTVFLTVLVLASLAQAALARTVIGITPAFLPGAQDRQSVAAFENELSGQLGESVQVRVFDSEAAQLDWLTRFREIDAALFSRTLLKSLPAGTLIHLADLPMGVAATHSGLSTAKLAALKQAFRALADDERGRAALNRLSGAARTVAAARTEPPKRPPAPAPAPLPAVKPAAPAAPPVPSPKPPVPAPAPATVPTAPIKPTPPPTQPAAVKPPVAPTEPSRPTAPVIKPPPLLTPAAPAAPPVPAPPAAVLPVVKPAVPQPPAAPAMQPPPPVPTTAPEKPAAANRTRLLLIAAAVLLVGITIKLALLVRHWQKRQRGTVAPPTPPSAERLAYTEAAAQPAEPPARPAEPAATVAPDSVRKLDAPTPAEVPVAVRGQAGEIKVPIPAPATAQGDNPVVLRVKMGGKDKLNFDFRAPAKAATPAEAAAPATSPPAVPPPVPTAGKRPSSKRKAVSETLVVESGKLGRTKPPALFKRCAELPQPTVLRVRTPGRDICVHFAGGQICHAYTCNLQEGEAARQWSKLGYLMVREGVISEAQFDQVMEQLEKEPGLRFVSALQQLGIFDLDALRQILTRQAKTTVYFLTLFPEGDYTIEADSGMIPAEESIALQVETLLREAAQHQAEWTSIRKVLPRLNTVLGFTADGHDKLEQVRLSVHQHLLLSQIDGQSALGPLCSTSTLMDYEACRFLYMMVKAGVLEVVTTA